jgi:Zn-dependent oligopeptidase
MQYAQDRALREEMYRASATRAAEFGKPELDNTPLIDRILPLRHEAARLLGYASYADVSLVPKMRRTPPKSSLSSTTLRAARSRSRSATTPSSRRSPATISDCPNWKRGTSRTPRKN